MKSKVQTYVALPLAPDTCTCARKCRCPEPARQPTLNERAFVAAFVTEPTPPLLAWASQAGAALRAIVEFRSACHRWAAAGRIDEAEYTAELESLDRAGLAPWVDNLVAAAMEAGR